MEQPTQLPILQEQPPMEPLVELRVEEQRVEPPMELHMEPLVEGQCTTRKPLMARVMAAVPIRAPLPMTTTRAITQAPLPAGSSPSESTTTPPINMTSTEVTTTNHPMLERPPPSARAASIKSSMPPLLMTMPPSKRPIASIPMDSDILPNY